MTTEAKFYKLKMDSGLDYYMILPCGKFLNVFFPSDLEKLPTIDISYQDRKANSKYLIGSIEFMEAYEKAKAQLKEFDEVLKNYPKKS